MLPYIIFTFLLFIIVCYLFFLQKYYFPLYVDRITKIYTNINYYLLLLYFIAFLISLIYCFFLYGSILYEKNLLEMLNKIDWEKVPHIKEGSSSIPSFSREENVIHPEKNSNIFKDHIFKKDNNSNSSKIESASSEGTASQEGVLSKEKSAKSSSCEALKKENTSFSPKEGSNNKSIFSGTKEWCKNTYNSAKDHLSLKKLVKDHGLSRLRKEADTLSPPNDTMTVQIGEAFHKKSYKPEEVGVPNLSKENTGVDVPVYTAEVRKPDGKTTTYACIDIKKSFEAYDLAHQQSLGKPKYNFLERATINTATKIADFKGHRCIDINQISPLDKPLKKLITNSAYSNIDLGGSSSTFINNSEPPESPTGSTFDPFQH